MTACGRSSIFLMSAVALAAPSAVCADPARPALTVVLYNYASVPADVVSGGKATVERLYDLAGVETRWIDAQVGAPCASFNPRAPHDTFVVQMIVRSRLSHPVLGFIRGDVEGGGRDDARGERRERSGVAYISFDEIARAASGRAQPPADIFGYAMAHEIAHVLLPTAAHTRDGLMRERWRDDDFRSIAAGALRFTPDEEALLRTRVERSVGAQRADRGDRGGAQCGQDRGDEGARRQ